MNNNNSTTVISANSIFNNNNSKVFTLNNVSESPISVSNISFANIDDEIGPIPPPKMFSDAVISALQEAESNKRLEMGHAQPPRHFKKAESVDIATVENANKMAALLAEIATLKLNSDFDDYDEYSYDYYSNEWEGPHAEEVPAKEPQLSAMPKKSAMKKHAKQMSLDSGFKKLEEAKEASVSFKTNDSAETVHTSVFNRIRQFNETISNNAKINTSEVKLHVAKVHVMPSITLTNADAKSCDLSDDDEHNIKDYYGDNEKGWLHSIWIEFYLQNIVWI